MKRRKFTIVKAERLLKTLVDQMDDIQLHAELIKLLQSQDAAFKLNNEVIYWDGVDGKLNGHILDEGGAWEDYMRESDIKAFFDDGYGDYITIAARDFVLTTYSKLLAAVVDRQYEAFFVEHFNHTLI